LSGQLFLWTIGNNNNTVNLKKELRKEGEAICAMSFNNNGTLLIAGTVYGHLFVYTDEACIFDIQLHDKVPISSLFVNDSLIFSHSLDDETIRVVNISNFTVISVHLLKVISKITFFVFDQTTPGDFIASDEKGTLYHLRLNNFPLENPIANYNSTTFLKDYTFFERTYNWKKIKAVDFCIHPNRIKHWILMKDPICNTYSDLAYTQVTYGSGISFSILCIFQPGIYELKWHIRNSRTEKLYDIKFIFTDFEKIEKNPEDWLKNEQKGEYTDVGLTKLSVPNINNLNYATLSIASETSPTMSKDYWVDYIEYRSCSEFLTNS